MVEWSKRTDNIDWIFGNRKITLKNVPVSFNQNNKDMSTVSIDDIIIAENRYVAEENEINTLQLPILALIYAKKCLFFIN